MVSPSAAMRQSRYGTTRKVSSMMFRNYMHHTCSAPLRTFSTNTSTHLRTFSTTNDMDTSSTNNDINSSSTEADIDSSPTNNDINNDISPPRRKIKSEHEKKLESLPVTYSDISRAHIAIRSGIKRTPCIKSYFLSEVCSGLIRVSYIAIYRNLV